jgi:hypothetical protein
MLPEPSLLDAKTWDKGVLPNMGPRLGIFQYGSQSYPANRHDFNLDSNFYPSQPMLNLEQWQNIIDYYTATSPDSLPKQERKQNIRPTLPLFSFQLPPFDYQNPTTSFVKINGDSLHPLIISDAIKHTVYFLNKQLEIRDSLHYGPVVDIDFMMNKMLACDIGILNPNNGKFGKAQFMTNEHGKMSLDSTPLFQNLRRPVQITPADLNGDGKEDYLICEFGNLTGALSWMENLGNDKFASHVLRASPGAIKAYINDYNHDGAPDIWVLFAQGEEGIFLFTNRGHGNFDTKEVLRFPPSYGSSYFEFADLNKDGYPDIIYTCGDNADFSPILKPYHGVYLFVNDGTNQFQQKYFFPINGCYKAIAKDFDGDGDLDIATISFFADYDHQPEESFVYLDNKGNSANGGNGFDFQPYSFPEARSGRWLTMDAGDIDGDGHLDIILGNFSLGAPGMKSVNHWKSFAPFILLKNTGKK